MAYRFSLLWISLVGQVKMKEMPEFVFDFLVLLLERWGAPQERERAGTGLKRGNACNLQQEQHIQAHPSRSKHIQEHPSTSKYIQTHSNTFKHIQAATGAHSL